MAFSKGDIAAPFIQVKEDENGVLQDIKFVMMIILTLLMMW